MAPDTLNSANLPAGWYVDADKGAERWWDGTRWTNYFRATPNGARPSRVSALASSPALWAGGASITAITAAAAYLVL